MLMKGKRWGYTIFPKLIVAFLLVISPLYGIGLLMNKMGETNIRDEVSKSMQSRINYYINSLETEKEHMESLLNEIVINKDLQHFTYTSQYMALYDWSSTVLRIENELRLIRSSSIYIKSVKAHILTLGRTLSTESSISESLPEEYEAVKTVYKQLDRNFIYWHDRLFLGLAYPEGAKQLGFVLSIELNLDTLQQTLQQFIDYENSGAVLVNPEQGWVVANSKDKELMPLFKNFLQKKFDKQIEAGVETIQVKSGSNLVVYKYSKQLDSFLLVYVPHKQVFGQNDMFRNLLWLLSLFAFVVIILYSYWIYRLIHRPLQKLIRSFRRVEDGQMEPMLLPHNHDEFQYLFQHFNKMVEKLKILIHEVYEQKIHSQSSELKQLQSQINPHFLYNTYFILYRLAKINDNENVLRFSQYLGEYFQYITRNAGNEVTLGSEVQHSRTYVEIQNIRFYNRIQVDFAELPDECKEMRVPRLILQPVIENAYKYGLESKLNDGKIEIAIECSESLVVISVSDNGDNLTDDQLFKLEEDLKYQGKEIEYTGLLNVHRRLQIRFEGEGGIRVARGELGGLKVALYLPIRPMMETKP